MPTTPANSRESSFLAGYLNRLSPRHLIRYLLTVNSHVLARLYRSSPAKQARQKTVSRSWILDDYNAACPTAFVFTCANAKRHQHYSLQFISQTYPLFAHHQILFSQAHVQEHKARRTFGYILRVFTRIYGSSTPWLLFPKKQDSQAGVTWSGVTQLSSVRVCDFDILISLSSEARNYPA